MYPRQWGSYVYDRREKGAFGRDSLRRVCELMRFLVLKDNFSSIAQIQPPIKYELVNPTPALTNGLRGDYKFCVCVISAERITRVN
ncbi:hypothetical protein TNCV_4132141 [Trichonephila clavipes]|nr:hypothetical protein TNCV_4132141 [Trichonephila clavipes]